MSKVVKRAGYGEELLEGLSRDPTRRFGRGFGVIQLRTMRQFYTAHPLIDKNQSVIEISHPSISD